MRRTTRTVHIARHVNPAAPLVAGTVVELPVCESGRVVAVAWSGTQDAPGTDPAPRWALSRTREVPNLQDPEVLVWTPASAGQVDLDGSPRYLVAVDGWSSGRWYVMTFFFILESAA